MKNESSEYAKQMKQWRASEDYAKQYVMFQEKMDHIMSVYEPHKDEIGQMADDLDTLAVRTEIAGASDLHRGYYCPSLIYDIVIGNAKRGRLLKRLTSRSKRYYVYGFDSHDRLIWSKEYSNASLVAIEYLVYEGDCRYGFKRHTSDLGFAVTQEQFQNGRIISYLYGHGFSAKEETVWVEWWQEKYHYDEAGLKICDLFRVTPMILDVTHDKIVFERDNGYLKRYYWESLIGLDEVETIRKSSAYDVLLERKA